MSDEKTFHLAITMAGDISPAAYTAGVIDYMLEVLEKWEAMKNDEQFKDSFSLKRDIREKWERYTAGIT